MSQTRDNVGKIIVDLKNQSEYVKLDEHLYAIPQRADDLLLEQVFTYYSTDRKPIIFNPATDFCIELNDVKFMSMLARTFRALQDSRTPVIDLIEYNRIYPFMLFVNGRFIPWENIDLIVSYGKYYFYMHSFESEDFTRLVRTIDRMNLIILPSHIIYSIGVPSEDYQNLFSFDDNGLYTDSTGWARCIYYPTDRVSIRKFTTVNDNYFMFSPDNTRQAIYKYFNENFFFWNEDGTFAPNASMKCFGGMAEAYNPDGMNSFCVAIYNNSQTTTIDNIAQVVYENIETGIQAYIDNDETNVPPEYMEELAKPFELKMDRNLTYAENRANAINYILSYRTDLFYTLYELELDFFTISVDYEWITNHLDADGYLNLGRRSSLGTDYFIMVMVDGSLYEYYRMHEYKANRFLCPIQDLDVAETIELMFFRNIERYEFITQFTEGEYLPLSDQYFNDNTMLFCKETSDTYFEFPADGNQHFPVPHEYQTNDQGLRTVVMDTFYYCKDITVVPNSTFRYFSYHINDDESQSYKVNLSTFFYYCWDYDRYFVFKNGKRLSRNQYRLTVPCRTTTPFNEFEIYLAVPLYTDDRLEIFYLPTIIKDVENAVILTDDGTMTINKSVMPYISGSRLYTIWVNGRKIPISDMTDVDTLTILINNADSLKNVAITQMGEPVEEVESIYQSIESSTWDKALTLYGDKYDLLGLTTTKILDMEADVYENAVPIVSIMWELIREHYIGNALVDTTGAFLYDYLDQDNTAFDGIDQGGNSIIDAMNAERRDNLDIERYYP